MKNQSIIFSRKIIENSLENNMKIGFSWQPNTPKQEKKREPKEMTTLCLSLPTIQEASFGFLNERNL